MGLCYLDSEEQVQPRARGHGTGVPESNQSLALPPSPLPQRSRLAVPGASSLHASSLRRSVSAGSIESLGRSTISDGWRWESSVIVMKFVTPTSLRGGTWLFDSGSLT